MIPDRWSAYKEGAPRPGRALGAAPQGAAVKYYSWKRIIADAPRLLESGT